jgi:uncharacterized protein (TIGR02611 family)
MNPESPKRDSDAFSSPPCSAPPPDSPPPGRPAPPENGAPAGDEPPRRNRPRLWLALAARLRLARIRIAAVPGGSLAFRIVIALLGGVFVVGGLALVPLPGPGWAIVFAGLAIWAVEFASARRRLRWVQARLRPWTDRLKRLPLPVRVGLGAVAVVALAVATWAWWRYR